MSEPRDARAELVRAAALDVLAYRCSDCHLRLNPQQTLAEPTTIDDLDALVCPFLALDPNDELVAGDKVVFDTVDDPLPVHSPTSCLACHGSGLIPVVDELKDVYLSQAPWIGLSAEELELIERIYPEPPAFLELLAADSAQFQQQALNQLQLPSTGSDPVAAASLRFGSPLTLRDVAGELGVPAEVLAGSLPRWLAPLESGTLGRDAFARVYVASLCVLSEPLANRPDATVCERAVQALGGL